MMACTASIDTIIGAVAVVVGVIILIRLILLGGRLVRAIEKIAEKP